MAFEQPATTTSDIMTTATTPEAVRKPAATINDLTPRTDPKGGILVAMLLPAVQKCR